jgi:hypothetical protein
MAIRAGLRIRLLPAAQHITDNHDSPTMLLTSVTQALAQADVRVDAFVGYLPDPALENSAIICLPSDTSAAAATLRNGGMQVEDVPLVLAWLPDTLHNLASACEVIETANVHIALTCLVQKDSDHGQQIAFLCDDAVRADQLLWALSY